MTRLIFGSDAPFGGGDRNCFGSNIKQVAGGNSCYAILFENGTAAFWDYQSGVERFSFKWNDIQNVAISYNLEHTAIGLRTNGTCIAYIHHRFSRPWILREVSEWNGIIEVAASDAFFGLDDCGFVHHACFMTDGYHPDDYTETERWKNVVHIKAGLCNSVCGITSDGNVLCAGGNYKRQDMKSKWERKRNVVDLCVLGPESQDAAFLHNDSSISSLNGDIIYTPSHGEKLTKLVGRWFDTLFALTADQRLIPVRTRYIDATDREKVIKWDNVLSFSLGSKGYSSPFIIAVLPQ